MPFCRMFLIRRYCGATCVSESSPARCLLLGLRTRVRLALPQEEYLRRVHSVIEIHRRASAFIGGSIPAISIIRRETCARVTAVHLSVIHERTRKNTEI